MSSRDLTVCICCIWEHSKPFPMHGNSFLSRTEGNGNFQLCSISWTKKEVLSELFPMLAGSMLTLNKEGTRRHWYSVSWIFVYLQNQMTQCTFTSQINQFNYEYLEGFHSIRKSLLTSCFSKIILSVHLLKQMNLELSSGLQKICNNLL